MTNYNQTILDYTKTIELNPRYGKAYYNRGNAYEHKGEYDLAISDFTKALEIIQGMPKHTTIGGLPMITKVSMTEPSQITTRPLR